MKKVALVYKPKVLFLDIETSPNISYTWGKYEQDVLAFKQEWQLLTIAYKWQGSSKVKAITRLDFNDKSDRKLTEAMWDLFDKADIIIAHNGNAFDNKKARAKFLEHKLPPPSLYKTIDTLLIARSQFSFNSNKLEDLGKILGVGSKASTGGVSLWLRCMAGDKKAYKQMAAYNIQDVVLLEAVYEKLKPWTTKHPDMSAMAGVVKGRTCPVCLSPALAQNGYAYLSSGRKKRFKCLKCKHQFQGPMLREKK
jgi:hypothetical protein